MQRVENDNRILTAKKGKYSGVEVTITHRDPNTNDVWLDDYPISKNPTVYGCWVKGDSVTYN